MGYVDAFGAVVVASSGAKERGVVRGGLLTSHFCG